MRRSRIVVVVAAIAFGPIRPAVAQSAFELCDDSVPNRILSTGAVRAVVATVDGLRVCLAAEGFADSAAMHPRDWASPSRLVLLETRLADDRRQMQESRILTSWRKNDRPLARDTTASEWRAAVLDVVAAKWDVAARRMERAELEDGIAALLSQEQWIASQIDTLHRREDSLKLAYSINLSRARDEKQQRINSARKYKQRDNLAAAEAIVPEQAVAGIQALIDRLDAKNTTVTLKGMLTELDADNRVASMTAALQAIDKQPDPDERLRAAAARLRSILAR
jgi:hypothetical protein